MENNEILDLLEQEYLQEYRKIQNRLLKKIPMIELIAEIT